MFWRLFSFISVNLVSIKRGLKDECTAAYSHYPLTVTDDGRKQRECRETTGMRRAARMWKRSVRLLIRWVSNI